MWVMIFFCLFPPRPSFLCVFRGGKKIDLRRVFVVGPHRPGKKSDCAIARSSPLWIDMLEWWQERIKKDDLRPNLWWFHLGMCYLLMNTIGKSSCGCKIEWVESEWEREKEGKSCANVYDVLFIKLRSGRLFKDGQKSERGIRQLSAVNAIERRRGKKVDGHTWHLNHPRAIRQRVDRRLAQHLNKKLLRTMISKRLHHHHLERVNSANGEKNLQIKWRNLSLSTANLFNFAIILL